MKKIQFTYQRKDKRGTFTEYLNSDTSWKSINGGLMKKGAVMGNHYHKKCLTLFFLLSGSASVVYKNVKQAKSKIRHISLRTLEGVILYPYETHAWKFLEQSSYLVLKSIKYNNKHDDTYESALMIKNK